MGKLLDIFDKFGENIITLLFVSFVIIFLIILSIPCNNYEKQSIIKNKTNIVTVDSITQTETRSDTLKTNNNIYFEYPTLFYAIP